MSKKKIGILLGVVVVIAALGGTGYYFREDIKNMIPVFQEGNSEDKVYVEKLSKVMNQYAGVSNRYNGTVESQDTYEVHVDSNRKIDKIHVEVGDEVEEGQTLVSYDTSDIKMQIEQAKLEVESINNDIANDNKQIEMMSQKKNQVEYAEAVDIDLQIQNTQNEIAQKQFNVESKQLEISKFQTQVKNSTVVSKASGVVKAINENGVDQNGNAVPFMTILQTGEYRVKGSVDEQNIWMLSEGQPVVVRSRVDAEQTWEGTISVIDTEKPESNNNNNGYYMASSSDGAAMSATKYPFYIALTTADGLILGQHVYIELDQGRQETKEGLWLYGSYIVQDDGEPYVWAANEKNRLEKRPIELGAYDADMDEYEIVSGLSEGDYITWPMPGLYEGVTTVTSEAEVDYSAPLYNQEPTGEDVYGTEMMDGMDGMGTDMAVPEGGEMLYPEDGMVEKGTEAMIDESVMENDGTVYTPEDADGATVQETAPAKNSKAADAEVTE